VNVSQVPEWAPRAFQLSPGSLSGFIERQAWSDEGDCVEVSWTWFDPAKAIYVQHLR
jgi:GntR family transcriptional regulator